MGFDMTLGWMMAGMLVSSVGFGLFLYGKKQARVPQLIAGMSMMAYPAFVASPALMLAIGGAVVGGMWVVVRGGA